MTFYFIKFVNTVSFSSGIKRM